MLHWTFYGNDARSWLIALGVLVVGVAALMTVRRVVAGRVTRLADHTRTDIDDFAVVLLRKTHGLFLLLVAFAAASLVLALPAVVETRIRMVLVAGLLIQMAFWGNEVIDFWLRRLTSAQGEAGGRSTMTALAFAGRLVLWAVLLLVLLDNFGLQVTTLVTTLGVGGIAVALAAQSVLGDLLAAVSIYLDQPFLIGDFIIFDQYMGSVEYVGLRSTRIHSLSGEQIIVSNSDLIKARIHNYKRMADRRIVFQIGVVYGTPARTLARIPGMIRSAIEAQQKTRFDRSHFQGYGESWLNFETVYYVLSPDYNLYMDIQQAINLAILGSFEAEEIEFAFPTRTVILANGSEPSGSSARPGTAATGAGTVQKPH